MIKKAFKDSSPVMFGYFPIAITFGILAESAGVSGLEGLLMSIFVYAGASQFMAVSMISSGIAVSSIILATLFMNFRHFIMSASIKPKLNITNKKLYPVIGFFLTDETYSVLIMKEELHDEKYIFFFQLFCYMSWVSGTLTGYLTGMFIPEIIVKGLGIALYSLFVALIIPSCKKSTKALLIALGAGGVNTILQRYLDFNQSTGFMIAVIIVSTAATLLNREKEVE